MALEQEDRSPESGDFDQHWHDLLTGEPGTRSGLSRMFQRMPSPPRCKACGVPFAGPYSPVLKMLRFSPWALNQQLCKWCFEGVGKKRGGAEVLVSLLFTDVRGSTSLAEQMTPSEFRSLLDRFFRTVFMAVDAHHGVIDHIVGDGVMAMWTAGFGGPDHTTLAVEAGREMAANLVSDQASGLGFPAGVGVHTGIAWVGVVGETGAHDFTVLGDVPNTAARLGSAGGAGELVLSDAITEAAAVDTSVLDQRVFELKGKSEPFHAWVERVQSHPN